MRSLWHDDDVYGPALCEQRLLANTYLLKFGDNASLQVCVPWGERGTLHHCPVDGEDAYTDIAVTVRDGAIHFDPWPYALDEFHVGVHGRLLDRTHFTGEADYHAALRRAPYHRLTWHVTRA